MHRGLLIGAALAVAKVAAAEPLVLEGDVPPDGLDHFFVPFEVPPGTREIEVWHDDLSETGVLDWGLEDPTRRFRGWGGGNREPAVVGDHFASRGYLAGPVEPGTWRVVVGKAKLSGDRPRYALRIDLRDSPVHAEQAQRRPYRDPGVLREEARWYAGDFHVHSLESGDALAPLDAIADLAARRRLDFVVITDHNTLSQLDYLDDLQSRHPDVLFVPGMEFTTYAGHANAIGLTGWVDHKIGQQGVTIASAAAAVRAQGALFSINHPAHEVQDLCIGCAWKHDVPAGSVDAVEIATGGWSQTGQFFDEPAIAFWDRLCATGAHLAALGGSDDHQAGTDRSPLASPLGDPTTMVWASDLSVAGILEGVRARRTVVKLQGPTDPMVEIVTTPPMSSDDVVATVARLVARAEGATGLVVRWIRNGQAVVEHVAHSDPFELTLDATAPESGEHRFRAEILVDGKPRVVTSHVYLRRGADPERYPDEYSPRLQLSGGWGCRLTPFARAPAWAITAALVGLGFRRFQRRRRTPVDRSPASIDGP